MTEVTATLKLQVKEEVTTQMAKARGELEKFGKQSVNVQGQVKDLFRELAGPVGTLGIAAAIGMIVKQSIEAASALKMVRNSAEVVFGEDFARMEAGVNSMAASLHRNASEILGFEANLAIAAESLGIGQHASEEMSQSLSRLAIDFGKAFGGSDVDAMHTIEMALEGNTRGLRQYHIAVNDEILQSYASAQGIRAKVTEMNAEQKAILTYNFLMDKTSDVQKIAQKNTGDFNDEVKDLKAAWDDMAEALGTPILPAVAATFGGIATIVRDVAAEIGYLTQDIKNLFGWLGATSSGLSQLPEYPGAAGPSGQGLGTLNLNDPGLDPTLGAKKRGFQDFGVDLSKGLGGSGGGGADKEGTKALSDAKSLLSDIDKIEKDIVEQYGKQAEANKKRLEAHRDDLKIRKDIGIITKDELKDLERINNRLDGGKSKVDDLKSAWDDQRKAVEEAKRRVEDLNDTILRGAEDLKDALQKIDRETTKQKGEKIADLIREQQDLDAQLARGEGLSGKEQQRAQQLEQLLKSARASNPSEYGQGQDLAGMNELQRVEFEAQQRKKETVLEFNKKQEDSVNKLVQANIDLTMAQEKLKTLQGDLVTAMGTYETTMLGTYLATEDATKKHVANQVTELQKEQSAVDALANSYGKVRDYLTTSNKADNINQRASGGLSAGLTLVGEQGPELLNLPSGSYVHSNRESRDMLRGGDVHITIQSMYIAKEADADEVVRRITRQIQLQQQGSSA